VIYEYGKTLRITLALVNPTTGVPTDDAGPVVLTVTRADATIATPAVSHPGTGSYYADIAASVAGDLRWVWTGAGSAVLDEAAAVVAAPGTAPAWSPDLDAVAAHVPMRTVEVGNVNGTLTGTFTGLTMPTAGQVEQYIVEAVARIVAACGPIDPTLGQEAASVAAMWAAAQVELAQPAEASDPRRYAELLAAWNTSLAALADHNEAASGAGPGVEPGPVYAFPEPVVYGDLAL
jgi:hypothetical protein